jgi:hypothetical protein
MEREEQLLDRRLVEVAEADEPDERRIPSPAGGPQAEASARKVVAGVDHERREPGGVRHLSVEQVAAHGLQGEQSLQGLPVAVGDRRQLEALAS